MPERRYKSIQNSHESQSLIKRIKQTSVVLSDLDGLLVNSENFNQIFVHRTSRAWMQSTISRVVKSDLHLRKFLQVLIKFITTERHPEWARHALVWLRFLLSHYPIVRSKWVALSSVFKPLLNQANELAGLHDMYIRAALRGTAVEQCMVHNLDNKNNSFHTQLLYDSTTGIPSTGYVFVDDSDEEPSKKHNLSTHSSSSLVVDQNTDSGSKESKSKEDVELGNDTEDEEGSLLLPCDSESDDFPSDKDEPSWGESDDDQDESEDQLDAVAMTPSDSDHGVFDVNDTASSSSRDHELYNIDDDTHAPDEDISDQDDAENAWNDQSDLLQSASLHPAKDFDPESSNPSVSETVSEIDEETEFLLLGQDSNGDRNKMDLETNKPQSSIQKPQSQRKRKMKKVSRSAKRSRTQVS